MLIPLVVYEFSAGSFTWIGKKLVELLVGMGVGELSAVVRDHSSALAACIRAAALICTAVILYFLFRRRDAVPLKPVKAVYHGGTALAGALLAMGLNLAISNLYIMINGDPERLVQATIRAEIPLGLAVLLYVIVTPVVEEMLFRWLIYGRISRIMGASMAVWLTALFFGFFHGNLLQGIYAALMGLALALVLRWSDNILLPVVFHMAANASVYLVSALPGRIYDLLVMPVNSVIYTLGGLAVTAYLYRGLNNAAVKDK